MVSFHYDVGYTAERTWSALSRAWNRGCTRQRLTLAEWLSRALGPQHSRRRFAAIPWASTRRSERGAVACYLLQLVHELFVPRILAAAGLDQTRAHLLPYHLGGVQAAEDAGEQVGDVLGAQRGGAHAQQLGLRERRERELRGGAAPTPEARVEGLGIGEGGQPGGPAGAAEPGQTRAGRPRRPSESVGSRLRRQPLRLPGLHGN